MLYDSKWEKLARTEKPLADIYRDAASLVQKHGHCHGSLQDAKGRMCIWGAINLAVEGNPFMASVRTRAMLEPIRSLIGESVIDWNNDPHRTKRQVISLLLKAAKAQRSSEVDADDRP